MMKKAIMEVNLMSAKGLKHTDFLGKIDPYVVIHYKTQQHTSTTARGQGSRPVWNEKFEFMVEYPARNDDNNDELVLQLMDRDTYTQDDYLGQTKIYLKNLVESVWENGKAELGTQKYRVVLKDQTYHGEVQLGITLTVKE